MRRRRDIVLSDHMVRALQFIERYRYLTVDQVKQIVPLKRTSVSDLLRGLEQKHVLASFGNVGIRGYGKTPKVYYLTKFGHDLLHEEFEDRHEPIGRFRPVNVTKRWSPRMFHRLATLDVMMAVERDVAKLARYALPATFVEYRRTKDRYGQVAETADYVDEPQTGDNKLVPDAGFVLEQEETGKCVLFLVEVDCGTEAELSHNPQHIPKTFLAKMEKYDRYLQGKRFQKKYRAWGDFPYFVMLTVTTSEQRIENIRGKLASFPKRLHQYYRFSTFERISSNFFHTQWFGRTNEDNWTYSLIKGGQK